MPERRDALTREVEILVIAGRTFSRRSTFMCRCGILLARVGYWSQTLRRKVKLTPYRGVRRTTDLCSFRALGTRRSATCCDFFSSCGSVLMVMRSFDSALWPVPVRPCRYTMSEVEDISWARLTHSVPVHPEVVKVYYFISPVLNVPLRTCPYPSIQPTPRQFSWPFTLEAQL